MKSSRLRTVIVCVIAILVGIYVIAGAIVVTTSERYFKDHYAARNPPWVSDIFLRGRVFLGQYREPPSNEEMILYFYQHEAEFEQLVTDYYALIKYFYDYKKTSMHDRSEMLRFQMAELGIRRVTPGGPVISNSIHGDQPFQQFGMHLYLFDRGGSLNAYPDAEKGYEYAPRVRDQSSQKGSPILRLINTGQYRKSADIPKMCESRINLCCGMQEISANWAATKCINASN